MVDEFILGVLSKVNFDGMFDWEFSVGIMNYVLLVIGGDGIVYMGWEDGNVYVIDLVNSS